MRFCTLFVIITIVFVSEARANWTTLAAGMDLGSFKTKSSILQSPAPLTILRIDPTLWDLVLLGSSWNKTFTNLTAKQWCKQHQLTAAINAGMFATDYATHIGYMGTRAHINNSHINRYMSVAAFNPEKEKGSPPFRIFDLDAPGVTMRSILKEFTSVVQNLRLIKRPGENRWSQQKKIWSEAALGEDSSGKVLFIFSRSAFSMYELNQQLLSLDIGLVAAQHLEGGPEAQLYFEVGGVTREMFGSFETSVQQTNQSNNLWPIPNVIGVRKKPQL